MPATSPLLSPNAKELLEQLGSALRERRRSLTVNATAADSTGRQLAKINGFKTFTLSLLLQPDTNIQLGTTYLRMLLDDWGGKWEETLASYNAGKGRVVNWVTWGAFREPAEFVESIPFNETHEYVQAVIRNGAIYREIYGRESNAKMGQK